MSKIVLIFLFIISLIPCCIEVDISAPSFPDMTHYFNTSEGTIQLTIAYNFLGFCLASLFYGPLSESYGRRRVMIIGNAILLVGALGCAWAPSISWLLVARFIQGIGASTSAVVVFAIIADIYQGEKAVKLVGIMNSVLTTLIALAPVAGGFINQYFGWRGNYLIVALISLFSWLCLLYLLPETRNVREKFTISKTFKDYGQLISSAPFFASSLLPSLLYSAYLSFVACASFLYIETFGLSILAYSLHQGFIIACFSVMSCFTSQMTQRWGSKWCIIMSMKLCILGSLALVMISVLRPNSPFLVTLSMALYDIGFAICYPVIFAASLEIFPEKKGTASSAIMGMRALVSSGFVGLTGLFYNGHPIRIAIMILCASALSVFFARYILETPYLLTSLAKKT